MLIPRQEWREKIARSLRVADKGFKNCNNVTATSSVRESVTNKDYRGAFEQVATEQERLTGGNVTQGAARRRVREGTE